MTEVVPFLWFSDNVDEARDFYLEIFEDSEVISSFPGNDGQSSGVTLRLGDLKLILFKGGDAFKLSPACSLMITCRDQDEIDHYWDRLLDGGKPSQCGWLEDRFGLSWQVTPKRLMDWIEGSDREGAGRATEAMLGMVKMDIAELERAYAGE